MANLKTASVRWMDGIGFEAKTQSGHQFVIDGPSGEGKNRGPSPMELVLVGLAGCTGMDIIDILKKKRLDVKGLEVQVAGTRAETYPMVYTALEVVYIVRGKDIPAHAVEQAIHLSEEKYCSVGAMLTQTAKLTHRYEIIAE